MSVLTGSFAGCNGRGVDLAETRMTVTLVGTFDIGAELWTKVVRPAPALVNVCDHGHPATLT